MTLYDQILNLPLFQGLSHDDLSDIVSHTKFDFLKVKAGSIIVRENTPCTHLRFLLSGSVCMHSHADDNSYSVDEILSAPNIFEVERLFGLTQYYSHTITAYTECSLLVLTKEEIMQLSDELLVFRINLFNRMATDVQKLRENFWRKEPKTLPESIMRFFVLHSAYPAGHKVFNITMQTLANEVHQSRLNVSNKLNEWNRKGLIIISRSKIDIPRLEKLLQLKDNP